MHNSTIARLDRPPTTSPSTARIEAGAAREFGALSSRRLGAVTSLVLLAAAAGVLFWRSDLGALQAAARDLTVTTIGAIFLLLLAGGVLAGWRLKMISSEFGVPLSGRDAIVLFAQSTIIGNFVFQVFGQMLARSIWLSRQGHSRSVGVLMTLYEKGIATAISLGMGIVGAWYLFGRLSLDWQHGGAELIRIGLGIGLVFSISAAAGWGPALVPFLRRPLNRRFFAGLGRISLLSLLVQGSTMLAYVMACRALAPDVPAADLVAATALVMLAASLPISFAGWGLREISAVVALGAIGVAVEKALLIAVLIGVASQVALLAIVLVGFALARPVPRPVVAPAARSEAIAYDRALGWAVPLCAAMAVFFQVHVPLKDALINVNLADPVAIIGAGLFLAVRFGRADARPVWRLRFLETHVVVATLVLAAALLHGFWVIGPTEWAMTNKFLGWFMLLAYAATGALIVTAGGRAGLATLARTFAAAGAAVALFDFGLSCLARLGYADLSVDEILRMNGFAQNPNAFGFQMLLAIGAALVTAGSTSAAVPILSVSLFGLWMAGSRAALVALPVMLLAASLMRVRLRGPLLRALPGSVLLAAITGFAAVIGTAQVGGAAGHGIEFVPALIVSGGSNSEHWTSVIVGVQRFLQSPWFGSGLGVFIHEQMQEFGRPLVIHSTPVWLLAEAGLIGLLAFAAPFGRVLVSEWRRRDMKDIGGQLIVVTMVAFAVTAMAHELLYQRALWLLLGAALAVGTPAGARYPSRQLEPTATREAAAVE